MNRTQRIILLSTAAVLIFMLLFPPFYSMQGRIKVSEGYHFISNPAKMAYWDTEANNQTYISFVQDIMSQEKWWTLSAEEQRRVQDLYFDQERAKYPKKIDAAPASVDIFQLLVQGIIVIMAGAILWLALKDAKQIAPSALPAEEAGGTTKSSGDRSTSAISRHLWRAILGQKHRTYYEDKFGKSDWTSSALRIGWNWPAFFGGGVWALYRKMYGWFFIAWIVQICLNSFYKAAGGNDQFGAVLSFNICVNACFAVFANSLYQNNLRKKIVKARAAIEDEDRLLEHLRHLGGVHTSVIWACIVLPIIGILLAIMIPTLVGR